MKEFFQWEERVWREGEGEGIGAEYPEKSISLSLDLHLEGCGVFVGVFADIR